MICRFEVPSGSRDLLLQRSHVHQLFRRFELQKFSLPALGWPCVFSLSSVVGWSYSRTPQVYLAAALPLFFQPPVRAARD